MEIGFPSEVRDCLRLSFTFFFFNSKSNTYKFFKNTNLLKKTIISSIYCQMGSEKVCVYTNTTQIKHMWPKN